MSLSRTAAKYVATCEGGKEVLFVRGLLKFVHPDREEKCTTVFEGNQDVNELVNNSLSYSRRKKHTDVHDHIYSS